MLKSRHCAASAAGVAKLADARDLKSDRRGSLNALIGAAIPAFHAVFRFSPLCFSLLLSASIWLDLSTPLTLY
jgi:hypothetical protein